VGEREAAEAAAMHEIAELLDEQHAAVGLSRSMAGQVGQVLHMTANEVSAGRGVAIGVRRAVRGLANAVREELDPAGELPDPG
jgi:hypothetical protein